eukprot:TRINITY_DN38338_c0_g1_i1.p1 TRINITY_DN38338_c0_g1~~TRINITY_DN38338_c0_g1_i1.p1  ORF type:complete len:456 (-),score=80.68 TRINITY_DN38338_c0_g1_i1:183-1550(-)
MCIRDRSKVDPERYEPLNDTDAPKPDAGPTDDEPKRGASNASTWFTLFKSVVGTGMIALPPAVKTTGYLLAPIGVCIMCALSLYTMAIIIRSIRGLRKKLEQPDKNIEWLCLSQRLGPGLNALSSFSLISCQLGSCVAYVVFILMHCSEVIDIEVWGLAGIVLLGAVPLALLRSMDRLSFTSVIGNITLIVAIVTVYDYGFKHGDMSNVSHGRAAVNNTELVAFKPSGLASFFGVALFMFSAHAECISVEQAMTDRKQFTTVLGTCFGAIILLYLQFGLIVYFLYGDRTGTKDDGDDGTIFDNMGSGVFVDVVKITMSMVLFAQFPLTLLPATIMMESLCGVDPGSDAQRTKQPRAISNAVWRIVLRVGATVLIVVISAIVVKYASNGFQLVVELTGSFSNGIIAFVLPPLFYRNTCGDQLTPMERAVNWGVLGFGTAGTLFATSYIIYCQIDSC